MTIFETHFDPETKEITRHSEATDYEDMDEVELMHGEPTVSKPSYQVYEDGLLFSRFAWSLPSAAQATSDGIWAR
ncbi:MULTISPECIES: hypothetical protein [Marinobacter]|uniref:hypothetical protein n=1 Tax=Marinobacter TaxID=2742 RepID=UPI001268B2CB|nr:MULTISPECIES: hypothetical protein [unclassified Marinobacter]QFS86596.1 hypothetical protein FIV08_07090 [Marinobacter sp. THAF197a]QFT50380.1 hypothetical protein FIU96_07020 [Marinobacter sp. THAF39]QFT52902.1 hypothetical protein FIU96_19825 [Marinobacter sp. THAF39]